MPKYFALAEETLIEVLQHLEKDATALLYSKVQKAIPVQHQEATAPTTPVTTEGTATTN